MSVEHREQDLVRLVEVGLDRPQPLFDLREAPQATGLSDVGQRELLDDLVEELHVVEDVHDVAVEAFFLGESVAETQSLRPCGACYGG